VTTSCIVALAVFLAACRTEPIDFSRADCMNRERDTHYYPVGPLGITSRHYDEDAMMRHWFSRYLASMNEPTLSCGRVKEASYRFLWLRSFQHPVAIRVVYDAGIATLTAVELDGAGGYTPGSEIRRITRRLAGKELSRFTSSRTKCLS
jgi:hypothetical protein